MIDPSQRDPAVAGLAESHQIGIMVRSAIRKRFDMMNLCGRSESPGFLTFSTEGMFGQIQLSKFLPATVIMGIVATVLLFFMHRAIPLPGSHQLRTAGMAAWAA